LRTYELLIVVVPDLDEDATKAVAEGVQQVITANGGEIVRVQPRGRRRLAYPIKRYDSGFYVLLHAKMEREAILEMERHIKLSDQILRHLLVRLDEVQIAALDDEMEQESARIAAEEAAAAAAEADRLEAEAAAAAAAEEEAEETDEVAEAVEAAEATETPEVAADDANEAAAEDVTPEPADEEPAAEAEAPAEES